MLRFYKKKTDISGTETGDFWGFDASILYDELKPLNARCDTAEVEITVYPIDGELDKEAITAVVLAHGSKEAVEARRVKKEKDEFNAPIKAKIDELDWKRLRPIAEMETDPEAKDRLAELTLEIETLRATLRR